MGCYHSLIPFIPFWRPWHASALWTIENILSLLSQFNIFGLAITGCGSNAWDRPEITSTIAIPKLWIRWRDYYFAIFCQDELLEQRIRQQRTHRYGEDVGRLLCLYIFRLKIAGDRKNISSGELSPDPKVGKGSSWGLALFAQRCVRHFSLPIQSCCDVDE